MLAHSYWTSTNGAKTINGEKWRISFYCFLLLNHYSSSYFFLEKSKQGHTNVCFYTQRLPCITGQYNKFYVNNVKIVLIDIYNMLTTQGLAHWICRNGTKVKNGGIMLQTQFFTVVDVVCFINVLIIKFDCKCTIHYQRNQVTIYISKISFVKYNMSLNFICLNLCIIN